jgi:hypothetical protein
MLGIRRREFITLLGAQRRRGRSRRACHREKMRRSGVLMSLAADDTEGQACLTAFAQGQVQLQTVPTGGIFFFGEALN